MRIIVQDVPIITTVFTRLSTVWDIMRIKLYENNNNWLIV